MTVLFLTSNGKKVDSQTAVAGLNSGSNTVNVLVNDLAYVSDVISSHFVSLSPSTIATITGYSIVSPNTVSLGIYASTPTTATVEIITIN